MIDSSAETDIVFNYGTFDNSDPYFYLKFTRGIMRYALTGSNYNDFLQEYKEDHRSVIEQILMLDGEQKERLFTLLKINAAEANRYYNYQFYEDNCTTRAKKIINESTNNTIIFKNILPGKAPTYRELIHQNLDSWHKDWSKFAIDLLLGRHLDKQTTNEQSMFLPDYLMEGFDSATLQQHPLVSEKKIILKENNRGHSRLLITPFILFSFLALGFIFLSFGKNAETQKVLRMADTVFFFSLGLLGILITFVWLGRVDAVCRNNLNILWVWPTHALVVFFPNRNQGWRKTYFRIAAIVALLILLSWVWLPQQLNTAFVPLLVIIVLRGFVMERIPGRAQSNFL